jgi:hypothetical protein
MFCYEQDKAGEHGRSDSAALTARGNLSIPVKLPWPVKYTSMKTAIPDPPFIVTAEACRDPICIPCHRIRAS